MSAEAQHKTRALWLVGALHAFTHIYHVALLPLYLLMQRDFGFANVGQATALVTVMMIAYFLPSYFLGALADRVSRKKLLGWGLFINAAGFTALAFAPNYAWALTAVIVAGCGGSCFHPAATAMIVRMFPKKAGRALGFIGMGASVGFFIGPIYAGWRAGGVEAALGAAAWRRPVLELGLLGIVAAGLFAWLADEERSPTPKPAPNTTPQKLFPTGALWVCFLASAFAFCLRDFAGASMGSLGSLFLQQAHGYSISLTGVVISCIFLPSAISNPLFGHFSDRGRKRWTSGGIVDRGGVGGNFSSCIARLGDSGFVGLWIFLHGELPDGGGDGDGIGSGCGAGPGVWNFHHHRRVVGQSVPLDRGRSGEAARPAGGDDRRLLPAVSRDGGLHRVLVVGLGGFECVAQTGRFGGGSMKLPNYFLADFPPEATLSPTLISEACATLKRNRETYLLRRTTEQIIRVLAEVAAGWLEPENSFRQLALEQGPAQLGFSRATLARGLDGFFRPTYVGEFP